MKTIYKVKMLHLINIKIKKKLKMVAVLRTCGEYSGKVRDREMNYL